MLCGEDFSSHVLYHALSMEFDIVGVILEQKISTRELLVRRVRRLGWRRTIGQILFIILNRGLRLVIRKRMEELFVENGLNNTVIPADQVQRVRSANAPKAIELLRALKPDVVVVNGTRILSTEVLKAVSVPFINTHMGITPRYRGVHGGYWALVSGDVANCGVTIHLVDRGIDTGGVLYQKKVTISHTDNFNTYPILQIAAAVPLMRAALRDVRSRRLVVKPGVMPSRLWSHPTLGEYLANWLWRGVR